MDNAKVKAVRMEGLPLHEPLRLINQLREIFRSFSQSYNVSLSRTESAILVKPTLYLLPTQSLKSNK